MKTALIAIGVWFIVSLPLASFMGRYLATLEPDTQKRPRLPKNDKRAVGRLFIRPVAGRSHWGCALALGVIFLLLAACGGGSDAAVATGLVPPASVTTTPPTPTGGDGTNPSLPGCNGVLTQCNCPDGSSGPPPSCNAQTICPAGKSLQGGGGGLSPICCPNGYSSTLVNDTELCLAPTTPPPPPVITPCPQGWTGVYPQCVEPAPPTPPVGCAPGWTGVYPNCVEPVCPAGQVGTWPACSTPMTCSGVGEGVNGMGGCVCLMAEDYYGIPPVCVALSNDVVTIVTNLDPATISLSAGQTTTTLSWVASTNIPGDSIAQCVYEGGPATSPITLGPFTASNNYSFLIGCQDQYGIVSTTTVTLQVLP